jgi:hypothetical protein
MCENEVKEVLLTWLILQRVSTLRFSNFLYTSYCNIFSGYSTILTAMNFPESISMALYTVPNCPEPSRGPTGMYLIFSCVGVWGLVFRRDGKSVGALSTVRARHGFSTQPQGRAL